MIFKAFARHIISLKKKNDCVKDLGSKRQVNRKILLWGIGNQEEIVQAQNGLLGRLQDFLRKIAIKSHVTVEKILFANGRGRKD